MMEEAKADYLAAKQAIGKPNINILFIRRIKIGGKSDKNDRKIMAITTHRIYVIVTQKQNAKIEFSFHILELMSLENTKSVTLNLSVCVGEKQHQYGFQFASQEDVDKTAAYILALMKSNFPDANVLKHVSIKIEDEEKKKLVELQSNLIAQTLCGEDQPACGSFAFAYRSLCNLYNQAPLEEVIWDINKIYASHNCKDFKLEDFDHLEPKELLPLFASLSYNTWFTSLVITSYKLSNDLVDVIIKVIRRSSSIEEFVIRDAHITNKDLIQKISLALSANPNNCLKVLDLSKNALEDKGVSHLSGTISTLDNGLESLYLSEISMSSKGASILINSLKTNKHIASTLTMLNLSGNSFKADGAQAFCEFLAQPNALTELNIANTDCALDLIFGALLRGCQQNLAILNMSGNPFTYKKSKEIQSLPSFQQFFNSSSAIQYVDISSTKIPPVALKAILVGLLNNPVLTSFGLNLSHNELKSAGAHEICSCVKEIRCLTQLNLSDNGLESDLVQLCEAIQSSKSIKELNFGQNISKTKHLNVIGEALAEMVMSEILPLEALSLADLKLRVDATALFDCLGTNDTLTTLDISGNLIGDNGARLLAKALQINTKLKEIVLDRNNITHRGLQDILLAMARNVSLLTIPIPITDLTAALKHNSEAFSKCFREIEKKLIRNQSMKESTPEQVFKIHQNLYLSTVDHYTTSTDNLVVELQDLVLKYQHHDGESVKRELKSAKCLIKEADQFRQVLLEFFSDPIGLMKSAIEKFNEGSSKMADAAATIIEVNLEKMVGIAKKICPSAFDKEELLPAVRGDNPFKRATIYNTLMQLGKGDIMYKLCEANLSVANFLADHLKGMLVEALRVAIENLKKAGDGKQSDIPETIADEQPQEREETVSTTTENKTVETLEEEEAVPKEETEVKEEKDGKKGEELPSISARDLLNEISKNEAFKMPWEFDAGRPLPSTSSNEEGESVVSVGEEDTSMVAAQKARTRLHTVSHKVDRQKQKRTSIKRRPTFYRHSQSVESNRESQAELKEVDIPLDAPLQNESVSSKRRSSNFDIVDASPREHLVSVGDFDKVSVNSAPLKVAKDRVKPMAGRRAPTRVSNLAHMNTEKTDAYIDEQSKAPARPMSPRPVSMMPPSNKIGDEAENLKRRNTETAKTKPDLRPEATKPKPELRPETPKKPDKKESKKEKKGKSPIGGIKLPGLLKRKDRSSSKGTIEVHQKPENDVTDAPPPKPPAPKPEAKPEAKAETTVEESEPLKPLPEEKNDTITEENAPQTDSTSKDDESQSRQDQEAPSRPELVKRQAPRIPMMGPPVPGGNALLAEMKKRQNKDKAPEESKEPKVPPAAAARPQRPKPPEKPEPRSGSISKPPPPKRPPSIKKPSPVTPVTESPKASPPQRPQRPTPIKRNAPSTHDHEKDIDEVKEKEEDGNGGKTKSETSEDSQPCLKDEDKAQAGDNDEKEEREEEGGLPQPKEKEESPKPKENTEDEEDAL